MKFLCVPCDKPMTTTSADSKALVDLVEKSGLIFGLTHNYTGYPMVRQARAMVEAGDLGEIRLGEIRSTKVRQSEVRSSEVRRS